MLCSCTNDISIDTHEILHGVWAKKGFSENIAKYYTRDRVTKAVGDSLFCYIVDPLYCRNDSGRMIANLYTCPVFVSETTDDSLTTTTFAQVPGGMGIDKDSITNEERYSKNTIWGLEDDIDFQERAIKLEHQGNGYFLSADASINKFMKILNDSTLQYGTCNNEGKTIAYIELEKLFSKDWYFNRSTDQSGSAHWYDASDRVAYGLEDVFFYKAFSDVQSATLYERKNGKDIKIAEYDRKTILKKDDNGVPNSQIRIDGLNAYINLDTLVSRINRPDTISLLNPGIYNSFDLEWRGDTAYIHHIYLEGEFFLKIKKMQKKNKKTKH